MLGTSYGSLCFCTWDPDQCYSGAKCSFVSQNMCSGPLFPLLLSNLLARPGLSRLGLNIAFFEMIYLFISERVHEQGDA